MNFGGDVTTALGAKRVASVLNAIEAIRSIESSTPDIAYSILHLPIGLKSKTAPDAARELAALLEQRTPRLNWAMVTSIDADGNRFGEASLYLPKGGVGSLDWLLLFRLFDIHTRLGTYWLANVWRAAQLAEAAANGLSEWHVLVAASCSRSLLEGAAALHVNGKKLLEEWDKLKRSGKPTFETLAKFADAFNKLLLQSQYSTRLSENKAKNPLLLSPNVLTLVGKLAKETSEYDIPAMYEWLCDAVHPSFGSTSAFTIERGGHASKTHFVEVYAREPLSQGQSAIRPDVALASADAITVASLFLLQDLALVRWVMDDIGLTSGVAFGHPTAVEFNEGVQRVGSLRQPERNEECPCGSGRKFKKCSHQWGLSGSPVGRTAS